MIYQVTEKMVTKTHARPPSILHHVNILQFGPKNHVKNLTYAWS
jgi:hypothetical protein